MDVRALEPFRVTSVRDGVIEELLQLFTQVDLLIRAVQQADLARLGLVDLSEFAVTCLCGAELAEVGLGPVRVRLVVDLWLREQADQGLIPRGTLIAQYRPWW